VRDGRDFAGARSMHGYWRRRVQNCPLCDSYN
jgi:hypothetical protein